MLLQELQKCHLFVHVYLMVEIRVLLLQLIHQFLRSRRGEQRYDDEHHQVADQCEQCATA